MIDLCVPSYDILIIRTERKCVCMYIRINMIKISAYIYINIACIVYLHDKLLHLQNVHTIMLYI